MKKFIVSFIILSALMLGVQSCSHSGAKEHSCTDACHNGEHVYAHGEKGHTCDDSCHN